ncbi:aspartate aminotransferase family protein [Zavarzinia aquatilis]|uniref:Aspartate aminotransferase family protein n=1 Tax=Zavarzinia aquatilis TaxID=2211142 RepID=A0A317E762_9PROT|nr:aspartate aminotransferase family protein [Zavarzinia aquatilis]PWR22461.1 aspartate aminotransferase family protein [Zavarzinia aquatilis]
MTATPVRNSTKALQAADARHHLHPFTDHAGLAAKGARVITRAEGVRLWDSEGRSMIDGMSGLWCVNVGYGRAELAEVAKQQLLELPYYNTFFQTTHPPVVALSEKLASIAPAGMDLVTYAGSGSEANDTIAKLVRYFWNLQGKPRKKTIISRNYAYHGVTMQAASMSGLTAMHPQFDLPLPGVVHVEAPYWYAHGGDLGPDEFGLKAARAVEKKILELGPENVGAFIGEPIQGAGGVIIPPATYWPEIMRICRQYDVLVIADEVICGFGRTGKWFGSQTFGIQPDFMTMAKGLTSGYIPMAGIMMGGRVAETFRNAGEEIVHGFTYSGHPVAAAVALRNLEIMEEEGLVDAAGGEIGAYFQAKLRAALSDHRLVGEVRGVGMIAAMELVEHKPSHAFFDPKRGVGTLCRNHCFANGLVMRACRDVMVLAPPLSITKPEIDELVGLAADCIERTAVDLGR